MVNLVAVGDSRDLTNYIFTENLTNWKLAGNIIKFIEKFAKVDDGFISSDKSIDEISDDFDQGFIDDLYEQSIYNYPPVQNITNPTEVATREDFEFSLSYPGNCLPECFNPQKIDYDKFPNSEQRIDNFKQELYIYEKGLNDSFYFAILHGIRFDKKT